MKSAHARLSWKTLLLKLTPVALFLVSGTAAGLEPPSKDGELPRELVACAREDRPFFYHPEAGSDRWAGFEYDLVTAFADALDLEIRFVDPGSLVKIFDSVEKGECALGISRITRTEERERRFDFSPSYFPVRLLAVERKGSVTTQVEELRGKRAVAIPGSTYVDAIRSIDPEAEILWTETSREMFETVADGRADFLACDSAIVLALMDDFPGLRIAIPLSEREEIAFALQKGSAWTEPLTTFMNRFEAEGRLRALLVEYFGEEGAEMILSDS